MAKENAWDFQFEAPELTDYSSLYGYQPSSAPNMTGTGDVLKYNNNALQFDMSAYNPMATPVNASPVGPDMSRLLNQGSFGGPLTGGGNIPSNISQQAANPGFFSMDAAFGTPQTATNPGTMGWAGPLAGFALGAGQLGLGAMQYNSTKKYMKADTERQERSMNNRVSMTNTNLRDRQARQYAANPSRYESPEVYMPKNRVV